MKATRAIIFFIFLGLFLPIPSLALSLGPYSGNALDSQTGEPIEGASVFFFWERIIPTPIKAVSEVFEAKLIYTDKKGSYHIPQIIPNLGLIGMLGSTNVIIYQPGYQAYILKIWHDSPYTRGDIGPPSFFKEKDHIVKLERIPPNFNYEEHYRRMESFLSDIREYDWTHPIWGEPLSWEKRMELNLKGGVVEKIEFLRRPEWEANRRERD